jgi:hypothetical protein
MDMGALHCLYTVDKRENTLSPLAVFQPQLAAKPVTANYEAVHSQKRCKAR